MCECNNSDKYSVKIFSKATVKIRPIIFLRLQNTRKFFKHKTHEITQTHENHIHRLFVIFRVFRVLKKSFQLYKSQIIVQIFFVQKFLTIQTKQQHRIEYNKLFCRICKKFFIF
jgi:hypothetical protein